MSGAKLVVVGRRMCSAMMPLQRPAWLSAPSTDNGSLFHMQKFPLSTENVENDEVLVEKLGLIMTIGINRPHKKNSINERTAERLLQAFSQFEGDAEAEVGVLYGYGGNLCAGYDLDELGSQDARCAGSLAAVVPAKNHLSKPLVAAVSGYALGVGFELALFCDLRVMEETAVFGFFNRRFGVPSVNGGTVRLQALVGLSRALDLILTGRGVKSQEALACGLANRVVACGTALGQAVNLASSIQKFPRACLAADRASTYYASYAASSVEDALKYERDSAQHVVEKESIIGAAKFASGIGKHGEFKNISSNVDRNVQLNKLERET